MEIYRSSSLEEKRTILSELFDTYRNLNNKDYYRAKFSLGRAESLWGKHEVLAEIRLAIELGNLGVSRKLLENLVSDLINNTTNGVVTKDGPVRK